MSDRAADPLAALDGARARPRSRIAVGAAVVLFVVAVAVSAVVSFASGGGGPQGEFDVPAVAVDGVGETTAGEPANGSRSGSGAGAGDAAVREAAEVTAMILDLFAPYTAEDMWQRLGYEPTVANVVWRKADRALLVEESVTAIVQVDGKVRDRLEVSPKIGTEELEALARASAAVARSVGEREIVNVIVRAPKLVNIATRG